MRYKTALFIIIALLLNINIISYGEVATGKDAFMEFRVENYENVTYSINNSETSKYQYHTDAWKNAIDKFSIIPDCGIGFNNIDINKKPLITLSSCANSKEEWLGIAKVEYNLGSSSNVGKVISSYNFLNQSKIKQYNLTKEHVYQVALHELGHSFGLEHQPTGYENETIMGPYVISSMEGTMDLKQVDKYNLANAYESKLKKHWAYSQIQYAMESGWVSRTNNFRPDDNITRAEFVKILNRAFNLNQSSGVVFNDTKNHWAKYEIDIAVTNKVCNGKSSTEFKPNDYITREEAAVMIANYKKINDSNFDKLSKHKDADKVSTWAKKSVEGILEKSYMKGYSDNTFRPKDKITRAEAVVTFSRIS